MSTRMEPTRTPRTCQSAGAREEVQQPATLNAREQRFVGEYLIDLNGAGAVLRAGFNQTPASAKVTASRLLTRANVQAAVAAGQHRRLHAAEVRAEEVIRELARIAFADIRTLLDDEGRVRPVSEWPRGTARAVASVDTDDVSITRLRLHDKLGALGLLARHLNLLKQEPASGDIVLRWQD